MKQFEMIRDLQRLSRMGLLPSIVTKGTRFRALWSSVYPRPASETFHEFLAHVVLSTFGKKWWKHQSAAASADRHAVMRWHHEFAALTRRQPTEEQQTEHGAVSSREATGGAQALMCLGFDLYCLQAKNKLPAFLIERLLTRRRFQAARYEVAAAAIFVRVGFEIEFLDDVASAAKHCEFVANHGKTGARVAVEAKSRVRPGALHERGELAHDPDDWKGLLNLLRKAAKQAVEHLPLVIFLDVNLPATPAVPPEQKVWVRDVTRAADELERQHGEATPYSLLVMTNFGFQLGDEADPSPRAEAALLLPARNDKPISSDVFQRLAESVQAYTWIPREV